MYSVKIIFSYTLEGHRSLAKPVTFGEGTGQRTQAWKMKKRKGLKEKIVVFAVSGALE
jgi:hypothetical protein